ncbi:MAG: OmpA family protein [Deltaproteobacteria bacterium]|nr:OmpA family protein [Deltaproteobacteria bacterium]
MKDHSRSRRSTAAAFATLGAALAVLTSATPAAAQATPEAIQTGAGYNLRLFRPAMDSKGQFSVNGTDILGHLDFAVGLVVDYGRGQARLGPDGMGGNTRSLVDNNFTGTVVANFGLFNWIVLGLQLPFHLVDGPGARDVPGLAGYSPQPERMSYQGVGDFAFNIKARFIRSELSRVGLGAGLQVGLPTQPGARNWMGDPGVTLWPQLFFEWRPVNMFRLDINVGYRHTFMGSLGYASPMRMMNDMGSLVPSDGANGAVRYGSPITMGLAMGLRPISALEFVAETYAEHYTNALGNTNALPWEVVGGIKVFVQRNSYLLLGAGTRIPLGNAAAAANLRAFIGIIFEPSIGDTDGDGYRDDVDRCPNDPEDFDNFQDEDGCPELDNDHDGILDVNDQCPLVPEDRDGDHDDDGCPEGDRGDRDGDGILDSVDQCPDQPEDRDNFQDSDGCPDPDNDNDGILDVNDLCVNDPEDRDNFEDEDGCPDPDNDHDRIPDTRDRCPNEPETYNGTEDEDGCPDQGETSVEDGQIRILRAINFETNSARIRPDSIPIVEAVARTLIGNPQIRLVQVQGHADERGDDNHNLQLTQDRARSVVEALAERGVERTRLHSAGYGERCRYGYPAVAGQPEYNASCQDGGPRWCHSERAWAQDRRVVFLILATNDGPRRTRVACPGAEDLIPEEDRQYHTAD